MSHCNYQILIWGHKYYPIFKLQKRAVRILTHSHFLAHTAPLFKLLNLLILPDIYSTALLKFYYKYVHRTLPKYHLSLNIRPNSAYHSYPTRNHQRLVIPIHRHNYATTSICHSVINIINSLPANVTDEIHTHSLYGLTSYFKFHLVNSYGPCQTPNCYVCLLAWTDHRHSIASLSSFRFSGGSCPKRPQRPLHGLPDRHNYNVIHPMQ